MPVSLHDLSVIVVVNGAIQLSGLVLLVVLVVRGHRELTRMSRAVAAMVYQESDKIRGRIDDTFGRLSR